MESSEADLNEEVVIPWEEESEALATEDVNIETANKRQIHFVNMGNSDAI